MDKKLNSKKLLFALIAIILIIVGILVILLFIQLKEKDKIDNMNNITEEKGENFTQTYGTTANGNIDSSSYLDVMNCAKQYFDALNIKNDAYYTYDENGNYVLTVEEIVLKQNIYNKLSKNYITKNEITVQNIYEKVETLETNTLLVPLEISMFQNDNIKSFIIHILLETQGDYKIIKDVFAIVNIDISNNSYSIEPLNENYTSIEEVKINQLETKIEANENNKFDPSYATNEEISKDYINLYKRLALGSPEKMYNLLDEEYKNAKFGSLENFKQYIQNNENQIIGIRIEKYQVTRKDNYTQYVCIDQNGKYYIFREKNVMDYTVILDTYTIDLPEFIEKYEAASNENKVLMNIQRFFDAINDKDYKYAYSKLDATYKNNNFKTQADFENYVKNNFFEQNKLAAGKAEKQGDVYLYNVTISDASGKDSKTITTSFVMQLKEGTDFVMSFGVQ